MPERKKGSVKRFLRLLFTAAKTRLAGAIPLLAALAAFLAGWRTAPAYDTFKDHDFFSPFFATSAAVIATLFVGFALGARFYLRKGVQALITLGFVGVSEAAAIAGLSPILPHSLYAWLMGLTIGGGVGVLLAALLTALRVVADEQAAMEDAFLRGDQRE